MTISAVSNQALWGQAWSLVVTSTTATGPQQTTISYMDWQPEALRITFDVLQAMNSQPLWTADIAVYNADADTVQVLLTATWVTLSAGFQTGPNQAAVIWSGPVFQTNFTLENVVDQKVTLHCVASPLAELMNNIVSFSTGPFSSQLKLVQKMAAQVNIPTISYEQGTAGRVAQQRMNAVQYPRGKTVFGSIAKYLNDVADSNFLQTWRDGKQVYISEVDTGNRTPDFIYSPAFPPGGVQQSVNLPLGTTQSIVGTPQQIQQGAVFTVLLDPRLKVQRPPLLVQLAETQVTQLLRTPSINGKLPTILTSDLSFFVSQVRHVGDSRGNEWHTEVTGWSTGYAQALFNLYTP